MPSQQDSSAAFASITQAIRRPNSFQEQDNNLPPPVRKTASLSSESRHGALCAASSIHHIPQPEASVYPAVSSQYQRAASARPNPSSVRVCPARLRITAGLVYDLPRDQVAPVVSLLAFPSSSVTRGIGAAVGKALLRER